MEKGDYLICILKKPIGRRFRENGKIMAHSFEYNTCAHGKSKEEVAKSLADLLHGHIEEAIKRKINPFYTNLKLFEEFGKYCAEKGKLPERLPNIEIGHGMVLASYDLTDA